MTGRNNSGIIEPFTPFPNVLLDRVMPTLKDTEWRLLCVIVRQTVGWNEKGQSNGLRKQHDWLSQRQLMVRTGRNSAALSAALDVLVRKRLVDAFDKAGELLLTPQTRRKHQGRIYYGLCQQALQRNEQHENEQHEKSQDEKIPLHKANTTKETEDKRKPLLKGREQESVRLDTGWTAASQIAASRYANLSGEN